MWEVPEAVEDALWEAARRQLPAEVVGGPALTAAVVDRSRRYTSERDRLASPGAGLAAARDLAARALFFTVADAAKPRIALAELGARVAWHGDTPLRVLDLGAGVGAMSLGVVAHAAARGATRPLAFEAVDADAGALALLAEAVPAAARALGVIATVTTRRGALPGATPAGAFDLVVAGSVLNELAEAAALATVRAALAALVPDGALVIVEPALRATTRALHRLRDALLVAGEAHVLAPCVGRAAPCPMLADEADWCHEERPVRLPPRAARLAQVTGLRDGAMKLSYLVLRRVPGHVGDAAGQGPHGEVVRVVGHPRVSKGKHEVLACGVGGFVPLRLLARHRTADNRALERARRGDVLAVTPAGADVTRDARVVPVAASDEPDADAAGE